MTQPKFQTGDIVIYGRNNYRIVSRTGWVSYNDGPKIHCYSVQRLRLNLNDNKSVKPTTLDETVLTKRNHE